MRSKHTPRGMALITAIWMLAVLLILVGGFAAMVHSHTQVARNFGQLAQTRWAAYAGIRRAEVELATITAEPYTILDDTQALITSDDEEVYLGDVTYEVVIEDEAGKININTAPAVVLSQFFPPEVADAIIDWRDADSEQQPNGAEDDYYTGLTPPYHCKNAPFTTVKELLLVQGVTQEILSEVVTEDGKTLEDLLTVSSWDRNTDMQGQARVNIASADKTALTEAFSDVLTEEEIDAIITQRTSAAFTTPADLLRVPNLAREKVAQIYDRLTVATAQTRQGLVNINTAPVEVLIALPEMDEATAQAIVQYRDTEGPFTDVGALLAVEQISDETFIKIADSLTTRSQTFRVIATGKYTDGVQQKITCLLQAETASGQTTTRVLYWRE